MGGKGPTTKIQRLKRLAISISRRNRGSFGDSCYAEFVGTGSACLKSGNIASQRHGFWSTVAFYTERMALEALSEK